MPGFVSIVAEINRRFHPANIKEFSLKHRDDFAPGRKLDAGLIFNSATGDYRRLSTYLAQLPTALHEVLRSVMYDALAIDALTQISFSWAPAYENEIAIWFPKCGISVLVKSRYPSDRLPEMSDEAA